jgi:hypothetical protein
MKRSNKEEEEQKKGKKSEPTFFVFFYFYCFILLSCSTFSLTYVVCFPSYSSSFVVFFSSSIYVTIFFHLDFHHLLL